MYDFILDPLVREADDYFTDHVKKVFLLNRLTGEMSNFCRHKLNTVEDYCYFLSVLALIGLEKDDRRVCGTIDTIPRDGHHTIKNCKHSWVEFEVDQRKYVYDPLVDFITPLDIYRDLCSPRSITSKRTQAEVIKPYLNKKYAHKITDSIWQFKELGEVPTEEIKNGFIFDALQKGQLIGDFKNEECTVKTFVADEPLYYY